MDEIISIIGESDDGGSWNIKLNPENLEEQLNQEISKIKYLILRFGSYSADVRGKLYVAWEIAHCMNDAEANKKVINLYEKLEKGRM